MTAPAARQPDRRADPHRPPTQNTQDTPDAARDHERRPVLLTGAVNVLPYVAFFVSGGAGLVYEIIWTRYLALFLGHSAPAQVLVLMMFLGGMALGALAVGSFTHRVRRPVLLYAVAELAIGALGIAFHQLYGALTGFAYATIFPAVGTGAPLLLTQWTIGAVLILPASVLLGTTFPLMSAGLLRRSGNGTGRLLAALYCANGLGGALGTLIAGFALVGSFGLPGAIRIAGFASMAAAVLALMWTLGKPVPNTANVEHRRLERVDDEQFHIDGDSARSLLLAVAFGTAVASLAYEIAWTRMLSLVLGSATHSFELMLSAFILGMSLGAFWLRRRADRLVNPMRVLGLVQWLMGALAIATLPLFLASFRWTERLLAAFDLTTQGYAAFNVGRYGICLAVMLPATFCAGMTLPLITQLLLRTAARESAVGVVYGVNTIGSIIGVAAAAILLLPAIGVKGLVIGAAVVDMALGVWILAVRPKSGRGAVPAPLAWPVVAFGTLLLGAAGLALPFDRELVSSGVFRTRHLAPSGTNRVLLYRDGRTATVTGLFRAPGTLMLATNGKVDASLDELWMKPLPLGLRPQQLTSDASTQTLLPLLGLAHAPNARRVAVIGQGSGMTSHLLLGSSTPTSVTTVEIEREMILGSNIFYPANRRVFEDPRSRFVIEDARAYIAAQHDRFDLIVSEPSNPWVSGVASLFTTEFYRLASQRLAPDGVFVQWVQLYEISDELLLTVLAALHANFPSFAVFYSGNADLVIVAGKQPTLPEPQWSVVQLPNIAADLRNFIPLTPQTLESLRLADAATFAPLLSRVAPNSDFRPVLDLGAERDRYMNRMANDFIGFTAHRFDPFAALAGRRVPLGAEPQTNMELVERANAAALSARIRLWSEAGRDTLPPDARHAGALLRKRMHESFLAAGVAPPDWRTWVRTLAVVERDVHGLSAGEADERFYTPVFEFLRKTRAPDDAVAAVRFMGALASWDFSSASIAVETIVNAPDLGRSWLPADMLRDGAVVSKLLTGDVAGARSMFQRLTPLVGDGRDLRSRLLDAHLRAAEAAR